VRVHEKEYRYAVVSALERDYAVTHHLWVTKELIHSSSSLNSDSVAATITYTRSEHRYDAGSLEVLTDSIPHTSTCDSLMFY
jgi:hypothetical protein